MAEFKIVFNQVLILFLILIIGYAAGKFKILDSHATKKLSEIALYVTSPMMVLNSFFIEFSQERLVNALWIVGLGGGMFFISILLSKFIYKNFDEKISTVLKFTAIFSNCGYMGLPLLHALFGVDGVFYGSFYIVIFYMVLWSYGFLMFGGKGTKKQIAKNVITSPSLIAVYIGLIVFLLGIPVHSSIKGTVGAVGDMTMPMSMLIIGGVISTVRLPKVFSDWRAYFASGVRLVLMPVLALILVRILGAPALPGAVIVTSLAMPAATSTTMFAEMYGKDAVFSSKCVAVSTLLSIIVSPILISFMVKGLL